MKKILFPMIATAAFFATDAIKAQTVIFEDSFESYTNFSIANVGDWTLRDGDLSGTYGFNGIDFENEYDPMAFIVFNSTATTPPMTASATSDWSAKTGSKAMISFASVMPPDGTGPNNDWLISPKVQLIAGQGAKLSFWAKSCAADYGAEKFQVLVSTTGTAAANFTAISPVTTTPSDAVWHEYTYSLNAYSGQEIHVAIHTTSVDQFGFAVDDFKIVSNPLPTVAPGCATLISPANAATNAPVTSQVLTWTAVTGADSYDVYLDTNSNPTTLIGNASGTNYTLTSSLALNTTYYWKVIPKNTIGEATGCTVYSFTTTAIPSYCGPLTFESEFFGMVFDGTEPISLVEFAGINNPSDPNAEEAPHEMFLDKVATVNPGSPYTIKIEGNTAGDYTDKFAVFIDWNQNGVLNDEGEVYEVIQTLTNSDGTDGQKVEHVINVPTNALPGSTRMRVKKVYDDEGTDVANLLNPCIGGSFGQAEDYTVNVTTLAVSETRKASIISYPNPVKDIFNIEAKGNIKSVKVFDITGKQLITRELNEAKSQIDFSKFNAGIYVVTTTLADGTSTSTKVIKK